MPINRHVDKKVVVLMYNGILFSHKKEWNLTICDSMSGPIGYYVKWNKSFRERNLPYDFTYMWNLKYRINKQTKPKQTHRYREQTDGCQRGGFWGTGWKKCWDLEIQICSHKIATGNPSQVGQFIEALSWMYIKSFSSQSRHIPRLEVWSPVRAHMRGNQ